MFSKKFFFIVTTTVSFFPGVFIPIALAYSLISSIEEFFSKFTLNASPSALAVLISF